MVSVRKEYYKEYVITYQLKCHPSSLDVFGQTLVPKQFCQNYIWAALVDYRHCSINTSPRPGSSSFPPPLSDLYWYPVLHVCYIADLNNYYNIHWSSSNSILIKLVIDTVPDRVTGLTTSTQSIDEANILDLHWDTLQNYPCPGLKYSVEYTLISKDQCRMETSEKVAGNLTSDNTSVTFMGLEYHSSYLVTVRAVHSAETGQPVTLLALTGNTGK